MDNYTNEYEIFKCNANEEIILLFHKDKLDVDQIAKVFKVVYDWNLVFLQNEFLDKHRNIIEQIYSQNNIELNFLQDTGRQPNDFYAKWLSQIFEDIN